jgi:DNA-binding beta-propeller fold protein YncE
MNHHKNDRGDKVRITEPVAKSAFTPKTGLFAVLGGLLRVKGTGALSRAVALVGVALVGLLAFTAVPALALETHAFSTSFSGSGPSALSDPQGVAIDQSTGEVYVVDSANDRVEIFSASGAFISAFGSKGTGNGQFEEPTQIAVDNSTALPGHVYVLDQGNERVEAFNAKGEYQSQITRADLEAGSLKGVAVDAGGNLWIRDSNANMYEAPKGALPASLVFNTGRGVGPGLAIDPSGNFYIIYGDPEVGKFGPSGNLLTETFDPCGCVTAVGDDPVSGDIYTDHGTSIEHFIASNSSGSLDDAFGSVGPNALVAGAGVAVNGSTGDVYVADSARNWVDVFTPTTLAEVSVEPATATTQTTTTLHGTVNPDGIEAQSCEFEWGTGGALTHTVPCSPAAPYTGTAPISVEAQISGLTVATAYQYRISVTDANGTNHGFHPEEEVVTTLPAVQGLSTGPAEDLTPTGAKLTGSLSPDGTEAHYYFEYSTGSTPESVCSEAAGCFESPAFPPGADAGSGGPKCKPPGGAECSAVSAEATVSGLVANTTYHYRLVGVDSFGTIYGAEVTFLTPGPSVIDSESAEVEPTEKAGHATLQATITPDSREGHETTYQFEYGETTSYGASIPIPAGAIGSGGQPVSVPATQLSGLKVDTTYHYRVVAVNEYGTVDGPDQEFKTLAAALIDESVSDVAATSATLEAQINPLGTNTTCQFSYVTAASFQSTGYATATSVPCPAALGAGDSNVEVTRYIEGLTPDTVYHYRVIATNALGIVDGSDHTFTTQTVGGVTTLPDGRQWELVSPPENGSELLPPDLGNDSTQAAAAGGAVAYMATAPTEADPAGNSNFTQVYSARGPDGWESRDLSVPQVTGTAPSADVPEYRVLSADLSLSVVQPLGPFNPALSKEASEQTVYLRSDYLHGEPYDFCASSCYRPLVTGAEGFANVTPGTVFGENTNDAGKCPPNLFCGPQILATTPDLSHIVVYYPPAVLVPGGTGFYEWSSGAQLQPVPGVGQPLSGFGQVVEPTVVRNAISADGSRVYFSGGVREGIGTPQARTVSIPGGEFQTASVDGLRAFFLGGGVLSEFDIETEASTPLAGGVLGVIGASEDGSSVYFVSTEALTGEEENGQGAKAAAGSPNVYVDHAGSIAFIATLSGEDSPDWVYKHGYGLGLTSRVSPDGRWIAFMSERSLTGYDNTDANESTGKHADEEVYLYHAPAAGAPGGTLVCASCNPTGARPHGVEYSKLSFAGGGLVGGNGVWSESQWLAANVPGWTTPYHQSRYLSDEGRLFFNSSDALVPRDVNGTEDVYEYEQPGVGSCTDEGSTFVPSSGGCAGLISSGASPAESAFLDASESGDDVFFLSSGKLTSQSRGGVSVYDAHVCSGSSPCPPPPPAPPPACEGDACQSPVAAPEDPTPGSLTFQGPGNLAPLVGAPASNPPKKVTKKTVKCKKGFVKNSKRQCVKKKSKKKGKKSNRRAGR